MIKVSAGALNITILHNFHLSNCSCSSVAFHAAPLFMCVCIGASFHIAQTGNTKFHRNLSVCVCVCANQTETQLQRL